MAWFLAAPPRDPEFWFQRQRSGHRRALPSRVLGYLWLVIALVTAMAQDLPFLESSSEPVALIHYGRVTTPVNQILTPVGTQVDLPGLRPQALALSPDGRLLAAA